jgi:hypothetical protein
MVRDHLKGSGMAQSVQRICYGSDDPEIGIDFPATSDTFLFHSFQTDSGLTQLSDL